MSFSLLELDELHFQNPYLKTNCCSLRNLKKASGVYFIKENDLLVYIGMSKQSMYSTLYRHFQKWTDNRRSRDIPYMNPPYPRVTYQSFLSEKNYSVAIIVTEDSHELEKAYIRKFQPRDNKEKYEYAQRHVETEKIEAEVPEERECSF